MRSFYRGPRRHNSVVSGRTMAQACRVLACAYTISHYSFLGPQDPTLPLVLSTTRGWIMPQFSVCPALDQAPAQDMLTNRNALHSGIIGPTEV